MIESGAGRGSDTTGAGARKSCPTIRPLTACDHHYDPLGGCDGTYDAAGVCDTCGRPRLAARPAKGGRVVLNYEPIRYCERCRAASLGLIVYDGNYWRKECLACGSTRPFPLVPPHA